MTLHGALLLPKTRKGLLDLVNAILVLSAGWAIILLLLLFAFNNWVINYLQIPAIGKWFFLLPFVLLLMNGSNVMGIWYIRKKYFKKRASVDISTSLVGRGVTIGTGLLLHGNGMGLVFGDFANRLTNFSGLLLQGFFREIPLLWRTFSWQGCWQAVKKYKEYPLYVLPTNYISALSGQVPILLLTSSFGSTVVGLYSFSVSLLEMPLNLIGTSIAPVFMQKATEIQHTAPERLKEVTLSLYNKFLYAGLLPFGFLTIFGDVIFRVAFGAKWEMAGLFTAYLGYYYSFKLMATLTSPIYTVLEKQHYGLISNVLLLAVRVGGLLIGIARHDVDTALLLFGIGSLLVTFSTDLHILHLLGAPVLRTALRTVTLSASAIGLMWLLRLGLHNVVPQWV